MFACSYENQATAKSENMIHNKYVCQVGNENNFSLFLKNKDKKSEVKLAKFRKRVKQKRKENKISNVIK